MNSATDEAAATPPAPATSGPPVNCAFDELVPLERLVANPKNPNQHPESQVALLAKVIAFQGWRSAILVSRQSGFIVSGHGRYEAAKVLGLESAPVDFQDFPSEAAEWAHMVADNRLSELSDLDPRLAATLIRELEAGGFDISLTGFDAEWLAGQQVLAPDDFDEVTADLETEHQCPRCHYRWSGNSASAAAVATPDSP